jgi:hypothetical protein
MPGCARRDFTVPECATPPMPEGFPIA